MYSLYFVFCHMVCNFVNFQLLAKMLNFIFINVAWKSNYLGWWNIVQELWGHTSHPSTYKNITFKESWHPPPPPPPPTFSIRKTKPYVHITLTFTVSKMNLKPDSHIPKNIVWFASTERPLKMMKNAFYFISKAFFRSLDI